MIEHPYRTLEDVVGDDLFPQADLALRRGRHVDQEETGLYTFLQDAQGLLESFYRRFGGELVKADGYFYLLPLGQGGLPRRLMPAGAMLAGQALALLYLDPSTVRNAGIVERTQVVELLSSLLGPERLLSALNPRRRKRLAHLDEGEVRKELDRALRLLDELGFLDLLADDRLRLRSALMRFTDPVRHAGDPARALTELVARGMAAYEETEEEDDEA